MEWTVGMRRGEDANAKAPGHSLCQRMFIGQVVTVWETCVPQYAFSVYSPRGPLDMPGRQGHNGRVMNGPFLLGQASAQTGSGMHATEK